jgi:predicted nucleic acid-binding protein
LKLLGNHVAPTVIGVQYIKYSSPTPKYNIAQCSAIYAKNRNRLDKAGTPIGNMDLLIASHAMALGIILITNNTRHYSKVAGLQFDNWVD